MPVPGREYATIRRLLNGEIVDLGGILFEMDEGDIKPGDLYIAERNTGPKLLEAREISEEGFCIHPTSMDYSFNTNECVKVREHVKEDPCEKCESTGYTDDCMSRGCY